MKIKVVLLDAMGVMYSVGDDVTELLCPFIAENGGISDIDKITSLYMEASLGKMTSNEFWQEVGIDPKLEDKYLQRHNLTDGLIEFLEAINAKGIVVWCLSNDLSEWSKKLRDRFKLKKYFHGFVISGDSGLRKPDPAIFQHLFKEINANAVEVLFVDDNPKNLDRATELGLKTILFHTGGEKLDNSVYETARDFNELLSRVLEWIAS